MAALAGPELRQRFGVKSLWLFGSYARRAARGRSDVDLLVEIERTPGLFQFITMQQFLTSRLGVKPDLVTRSGLKPAFRERVLDEAVPL